MTKGVYVKGMQPMGKGGSGRNTQRKSHLRVSVSPLLSSSALVV